MVEFVAFVDKTKSETDPVSTHTPHPHTHTHTHTPHRTRSMSLSTLTPAQASWTQGWRQWIFATFRTSSQRRMAASRTCMIRDPRIASSSSSFGYAVWACVCVWVVWADTFSRNSSLSVHAILNCTCLFSEICKHFLYPRNNYIRSTLVAGSHSIFIAHPLTLPTHPTPSRLTWTQCCWTRPVHSMVWPVSTSAVRTWPSRVQRRSAHLGNKSSRRSRCVVRGRSQNYPVYINKCMQFLYCLCILCI